MGFVFMKMNMKIQSGKAIIISALIISIMMPFSVSAAPSAGIKPSSIFYFLDIATERVGLFFTFGSEKKARKALEYADERLAEAEAVAGDKNTDAVKTAITNYEGNIAFAAEKAKDIGEKEKAKALLTTISDSTSRHQEVLADVLAKVPDEAKEAITKAIEASKKGHEEAMQKIAELKGEVEQLKKEVVELKAKSEAEIAKAEAERLSAKEKERTTAELEKQKEERVKAEAKAIQDETERQRLQAEKAKAEAETAKAEAERQRLQAEIDAYKAKEAAVNTQKQAEINKGIYCNGKYWSQCPVGQTFACPSSGNAFCSAPKSSVDLNRAANNKSELINLQNIDISKYKKLLEDDTSEVARTNNILNQLTGLPGSGGLAYELSIAHRNLFMAHQGVDMSLIEYTENSKRQIENLDVAAFADEAVVAKMRDQINENILQTSQETYKRQKEIAEYDDGIRAFVSILNTAF